MKTITSIFILLSIACSSLFAQDEFEFKIIEENRAMTKGNANALVVHLPNTTYKEVNKLWNKYLKNFKGKTQYNRKEQEYFSDNAEVESMSENTIDITSKVIDKGTEGTTIAVWFNLGIDYLSTTQHPEIYPKGEQILKDFSLLVSADMIAVQLQEEEEKLMQLQKEKKTLEHQKTTEESNIEQQKKTIAEAQKSIEQSEKNIEENTVNQENKDTEIKEQEKVIETVKRKLKAVQK